MVEVKANRGIIVKPLLLDEIKKIIETRLAIEGYSSSILAEKVTTKEGLEVISILEDNLLKQKKALIATDAYYKFMKLDLEFHHIILNFTNNNYFSEIIKMLRARLEIATLKSLHEPNRLNDALNEHRLLVDNIKSGNSNKAFQSFEFHMQKTLEIMENCYDT